MKSRLLYLCALVAAICVGAVLGRASATTSLVVDSSWWQSLAPDAQTSAVQLSLDAYQEGFAFGRGSGAAMAIIDLKVKYGLKMTTAQQSTLLQRIWSQIPIPSFPKTYETYVHEIGDFYVNNPTQAATTVGDVIGCLAHNGVFTPPGCQQ